MTDTERVAFDSLLAACRATVALADRAVDHWDADEDSKVGKILSAMAGRLVNYCPEATALHAAIAQAEEAAK